MLLKDLKMNDRKCLKNESFVWITCFWINCFKNCLFWS